MRTDYLSRAKRKDNGEWVQGYYYEAATGPCIRTHDVIAHANGSKTHIEQSHGIIPETVGKCTGLTDKNGVLVFEGDIVTGKFADENITGFIKWGSSAEFYIEREGLFGIGLNNASDWVTVVGSIHDTPELLENIT